jgi:Tol biopolymer transport system component
MKRTVSIICLIVLAVTNLLSKQSDFPKLTGPYLGQKTPGMKAELFAPRIVSTGDFEHSSPVFSPDLTEIYWSTTHEDKNGETYLRPTYYMKQVNGVWSEPKIPSFGKDFKVCENPFIQPDGKRIYFHANKTLPEGHSFKLDLYYAERKGDDWSEPVKLTETINTPNYLEGMPSVSRNGTLYFVGYYAKSEDGFGLYYSKLVNGKYEKPALMEEKFNSLNADWTPYIAPDESYFIFCSFRDGGFGSGDLYICFKEKDGSWGKVINMGDKINTIANERFPNVTPDGKYFFFNSTRKIQGADPNSPGNGNGDIYWIDAKIIEELRPKN